MAGPGGVETEFSLQIEQENRKHRVIAETFAGIGERKDIKAGRLVFKHSLLVF